MFCESLACSFVPRQWKQSIITPVPKVAKPSVCKEFRPISVTPILSRLFEKCIVRKFLYPVLLDKNFASDFQDQYAFRPTGSTTSALISLTDLVAGKLVSNPFVHVLSFDMSKAFDTVRHSTLMEKLSKMPIPDEVYNWLYEYFDNRSHVTGYCGIRSSPIYINASIVQGSGLGPVIYILNSSDLTPIFEENNFNKYADDVYLVVSSKNSEKIPQELKNIERWAADNNLTLNSSKTREMVVHKTGVKNWDKNLPEKLDGIERVASMKILGVYFDETLSFKEHLHRVLGGAASSMYAIKILRSKGLSGSSLWDVTTQIAISKMLYASPVWWGYMDNTSQQRLNSVIKRLKRLNCLPQSFQNFDLLCNDADTNLFKNVLLNTTHVLNHLLPKVKEHKYDLRKRVHDRCMPKATQEFYKKSFINRMLYKDCY